MNKINFQFFQKNAAFLGILGASLFSLSFCHSTVSANSADPSYNSCSSGLSNHQIPVPIAGTFTFINMTDTSIESTITPAGSEVASISSRSLLTDLEDSSINSTSAPADTETPSASANTTEILPDTSSNTKTQNSDWIVIDDLIFQLSASSPDTLTAYETYQKATAYLNEWNMILVNKEHPLPDNYTFTQKTLPGYSMTVDERIYEPLQTMLNAGKKEGCRFLICSAYRSYTRQSQIYNSHIRDYLSRGYSNEKAKELTELSIAVPGSSEHQTGMAVDIVATYYQQLNENFSNTKEAKWLKEHAHEYGFILRYPKDKTAITSITFEPWHFRYVGTEAAKEIYELGVCYEEYLLIKEQAAKEALLALRIQVESDRFFYSRKHNPQGKWLSDELGSYFLYEDNTYPCNTWIEFNEDWYYFQPDGYMATGWLNLGNDWYYLNENNHSGERITGWYQDTKTQKWYYLNPDSGEMQRGWFMDETNGNRYYLCEDGSLLTAAFTPDGHYVDENGVYQITF